MAVSKINLSSPYYISVFSVEITSDMSSITTDTLLYTADVT